FIEEAAGIARYKQQRNETQGKLDAARQNLVRVRDVMDEVRRQLASLERQAKKAQQYKTLQTEKRDLGLALVAADYAGLAGEGERLAAELVRVRDGEQGLRTRLASLAARAATRSSSPPTVRAPQQSSNPPSSASVRPSHWNATTLRRFASNRRGSRASASTSCGAPASYGSARLSWGDAPSGSRPSSPRPGRRPTGSCRSRPR